MIMIIKNVHICILYLWIATDKSVVMNENGKKKM